MSTTPEFPPADEPETPLIPDAEPLNDVEPWTDEDQVPE